MQKKITLFPLLLMLLSPIIDANQAVHKPVLRATVAEPVPEVYTADKPYIVLKANQPEMTIRLKSNPTTGYSWFLHDYNYHLFTPKKHTFEPAGTGLMGAPGYETFTFKIERAAYVVPHEGNIRFVYSRPWQGIESGSFIVFHVATLAS